MSSPRLYNIGNKQYYNADELLRTKANPLFFRGCSKSSRICLQKHTVPEEHYVFAKADPKNNNIMKQYNETYKPSILHLTKEYVDEYAILNKEEYIRRHNERLKQEKEEQKKRQQDIRKQRKEHNEEDIKELPNELYLEPEEQFVDCDGNVMNIEVRGERTPKGIYLKAKDVGECFGIHKIEHLVLLHNNSAYLYKKDYIFFNILKGVGISNSDSIENSPNKNKMLYMTYNGLIKLLYSSRSKHADRFQEWATDKLFTIQMGDQPAKDQLGADCLNVNIKTVIDVFRSCATTTPCVYLFQLGKVKDLRDTFPSLSSNQDDEAMVCKYGRTDNLARRSGEHERNYGKMNNVSLELLIYSYVDPAYAVKAENRVKEYFQFADKNIKEEAYNEIMVLNKDELKRVSDMYNDVATLCMGRNAELINKIKEMEEVHKNALLQKDYELLMKENQIQGLKKDNEIQGLKKDNEIQQYSYENQILEKDNEILRLKLHMYEK